jgi:2-polyprenyl-3-methyl-5-hydroxy-6-metoxy-1,4-benzoquinol methylase
MDVLAPIYPVMRKYGVTSSPNDFHSSVNLAFHKAESKVYDIVHRCMWESLPQQYELLVADFESAGGLLKNGLIVLDTGCGTGLASELLLRTTLGKSIAEVDLLDTSPEMLEQAKGRAETWNVKPNILNGIAENLTSRTRKYDIIVICSVLHHIPNLASFLHQIQMLQSDGGILIHLQDPNGDYLTSPVLKKRIAELEKSSPNASQRWLSRLHPRRVFRKIKRELTRTTDGESDYIGMVNKELLESGIIRKRMSAVDIWTVTDIHIHDGNGISIKQMLKMLDQYQLIATRSYAFFGRLSSTLPNSFLAREQELIQQNASNGSQIAGVWKRHCRS